MRVFHTPSLPTPEVQLFSNGRYHLFVSSAGGGQSRWRDLALTRWREDATRDCWGAFIYLRDTASGEFWSAGYQPALRSSEDYEATFTEAKAELRQRRGDLEIGMQIWVSPEDDVEVRRLTLTNHSRGKRSIELTSYAEVVLAVPGADLAHPVFSNLFVQTEFLTDRGAILCTRRPRSEAEERPWLLHLMAAH
jgi:cyclic beta-1,2-glucan synthetase